MYVTGISEPGLQPIPSPKTNLGNFIARFALRSRKERRKERKMNDCVAIFFSFWLARNSFKGQSIGNVLPTIQLIFSPCYKKTP